MYQQRAQCIHSKAGFYAHATVRETDASDGKLDSGHPRHDYICDQQVRYSIRSESALHSPRGQSTHCLTCKKFSRAKGRAQQSASEDEPAPVLRYLRFQAKRPGLRIEWPVRPESGWDRKPNIVWPLRRVRLLALLRFVAGLSKIEIQ